MLVQMLYKLENVNIQCINAGFNAVANACSTYAESDAVTSAITNAVSNAATNAVFIYCIQCSNITFF